MTDKIIRLIPKPAKEAEETQQHNAEYDAALAKFFREMADAAEKGNIEEMAITWREGDNEYCNHAFDDLSAMIGMVARMQHNLLTFRLD